MICYVRQISKSIPTSRTVVKLCTGLKFALINQNHCCQCEKLFLLLLFPTLIKVEFDCEIEKEATMCQILRVKEPTNITSLLRCLLLGAKFLLRNSFWRQILLLWFVYRLFWCVNMLKWKWCDMRKNEIVFWIWQKLVLKLLQNSNQKNEQEGKRG